MSGNSVESNDEVRRVSVEQDAAATKIQAQMRGFSGRRKAKKKMGGTRVMGGTCVMKEDHFAGVEDMLNDEFKIPSVTLNEHGVPNFRKVSQTQQMEELSPFVFFASGQPSEAGIGHVSEYVKESENAKKIIWVNLREEVTVFVDGTPMSAYQPGKLFARFSQIEGTAHDDDHLANLETQLAQEIQGFVGKEGDQALYGWVEKPDSQMELVDRTPQNGVETWISIVQGLGDETVQYMRVPVSEENAAEEHDFDALVNLLDEERQGWEQGQPKIAVVFSCHTGGSRSTMALVIGMLLEHFTLSVANGWPVFPETAPLEGYRRPVIVTGTAGAGKSELIQRLLDEFPNDFGFCVSHTTRPAPQQDDLETEGYLSEDHTLHTNSAPAESYIHLTEEEFMGMVEGGEFVEWVKRRGNMYGTSFESIQRVHDQHKIAIMDMDYRGASKIVGSGLMKPHVICVQPKDTSYVMERLAARTEDSFEQETVEQMVVEAQEGLKAMEGVEVDVVMMGGDDDDVAFQNLRELVFQPDFENGYFNAIRSLVRQIDDGYDLKGIVDMMIGQCSQQVHLSRAVLIAKVDSELERKPKRRSWKLNKAFNYLERYFYLIAFCQYLHMRSSGIVKESFFKWTQKHPELYRLLDDLGKTKYLDHEIVISNEADGSQVKEDHFPNIHVLRRKFGDGVPNFRQVNGLPVFGCAQPTVDGVREVLDYLIKEKGFRNVHWTNMREEAVLYINGRPFTLRHSHNVNENVSYPGIEGHEISKLERKVAQAVQRSVDARGDGNVEFWAERELFKNELLQEPLESIDTLWDVFQRYREEEGYDVTFHRIPITDETAPEEKDFDELTELVQTTPADTALVFNCQMGRGRTTTAMVCATMLWPMIHGVETAEARRPVCLMGPPGTGKRTLIESLVNEYPEEFEVVDMGLSILNPEPAKIGVQVERDEEGLLVPEASIDLFGMMGGVRQEPIQLFTSYMENYELARDLPERPVMVLMKAPSMEQLKKRLEDSGLDDEKVTQYMTSAEKHYADHEGKEEEHFDVVIVNDDVRVAVHFLKSAAFGTSTVLTEPDLLNGEYKVIRELSNVIESTEPKRIVDIAIDKCNAMQSLRQATEECKVTAENHPKEEKRQYYLRRATNYLERYFYLIAFAHYVNDQMDKTMEEMSGAVSSEALSSSSSESASASLNLSSPKSPVAQVGFKTSYVEWMKDRPELYELLDNLYFVEACKETREGTMRWRWRSKRKLISRLY